jgi:hypothetical protein
MISSNPSSAIAKLSILTQKITFTKTAYRVEGGPVREKKVAVRNRVAKPPCQNN